MEQEISSVTAKEEELEDGEICDDDSSAKPQQQNQAVEQRHQYGKRRPACSGSFSSSSRSTHSSSNGRSSSYRPRDQYRVSSAAGRLQPGGLSGSGSAQLSEPCLRPSFWERSHSALERFGHYRGTSSRGSWMPATVSRGEAMFSGTMNRRESSLRQRILYDNIKEREREGITEQLIRNACIFKSDSQRIVYQYEVQKQESGSSKSSSSPPRKDIACTEEEEELSELHLRLLALQSASKKWHQKEQQVMKETKEKLFKPQSSPDVMQDLFKPYSGKKVISAAKQARRRQQTKAWKKLQQQKEMERLKKEEEEKKQREEEERKKREEEIRKIRDLSNQEEQYNRFMKLVGGKRPRNRCSDGDVRRLSEKQTFDTSGSLYQYDNYDEVAMDTDSENNSPGSSPAHPALPSECQMECFVPMSQMPLVPHCLNMQPYVESSVSIPAEPPPPPPPLPPDEPEQPPKPPFADEEEEEEMLLREELLKSLATKRFKSEETSTICAASSPNLNTGPQSVPRSNLSAVSVNTVLSPPLQSTEIIKGSRMSRPIISLPKHKKVVVRLNDSDDTESEEEPSASSTRVFGGLESMIKEARRTVEASKPKAASQSEKENDPMRTPEALPEDKKLEYRLLKGEIASRERHRLIKLDQSRSSPSPANSDAEVDCVGKRSLVNRHVSETESKLKKHEILTAKDEALLKHLILQEAKRKESVRQAECKYSRLREQLLAAEKILNVNKMFLKRLQEQIHRVQHRLSLKKNVAIKYIEELARARALASQELGKRKLEQDDRPNKNMKIEALFGASPKKHSAELIALEKKRLQQLELEYALKIQKLKEAQSLRSREQKVSNTHVLNDEDVPEYALPQPSLHDLTQDKLVIDTEENEVDDDIQSDLSRERRRSFKEATPFTKPNLRHSDAASYKDGVSKLAKKNVEESELFLGLNIDELKKLYGEAESLKELFQKSTMMASEENLVGCQDCSLDLDAVGMQVKPAELKPLPFAPYHSPLLAFKSYRFSPYFRTKEKLCLSSVSYSNMIEPKRCFCRFDLTGTCNDDDCQWQHMRECTLSRKQLFQDIVSYNLSLIGCSESSTDENISSAVEKYVEKLFGAQKDRMSMDQMAVLLVSKLNESKGQTPPFTTCKDKRVRRPCYWRKPVDSRKVFIPKPVSGIQPFEHVVEKEIYSLYENSSNKRAFYNFTKEYAAVNALIKNNERAIKPADKGRGVVILDTNYYTLCVSNAQYRTWKMCNFILNEGFTLKGFIFYTNRSSAECLDSALNVLARALESNKENAELWCHYLVLFSKRGKKEELQEMCETAVEYAPSYQTWWTFLNLETSFDGKDYICDRMLQQLLKDAAEGNKKLELVSFQILETLIFRVQLSLFSGRHQNALALLQNALKTNDGKRSTAEYLTKSDCCLAWLCYIHLIEFQSLPGKCFDPINSNPSRIVSKEPFIIPWQVPEDVKTDPDILLALFEDAVRASTDDSLPKEQNIAICLPLYRNMVSLMKKVGRWEAAKNLCQKLLELCPTSCDILEVLSDLYLSQERAENALDVLLNAFQKEPHNAELFCLIYRYLISQERCDELLPLLQTFVSSFFTSVDSSHNPVNLLRDLLNSPLPDDLLASSRKGNICNELVNLHFPYLWLLYCLWQSTHANVGEAVDTFEAALGAVMNQTVLQKIWMEYLVFTSKKLAISKNKVKDLKHFADLVNRCLITVPTRYPIPFSSADYWTNYEFHNQVISLFLSCLTSSQHSKALERFRSVMPANSGLAVRLLYQEFQEGNIQHLKLQALMYTHSLPTCLTIWKIAIAVESELQGQREVRRLYHRALQKLPLCAALWKDQLLFEASEGGKTDNLRKLVSKCQEVGVSLDELLNLNIFRTEGKNH
ncbi:zinc finger C3H1 domain-containing protein [Protopterus annectens]|uniref:zinc finger C3H1 domain-containing protein n=1 Tax=Protopterus annectens TaxID=7888 RepID=UPI001CF98E59|nr:zinc finger C3H1 domain-containing protein [Protopterus annectens]